MVKKIYIFFLMISILIFNGCSKVSNNISENVTANINNSIINTDSNLRFFSNKDFYDYTEQDAKVTGIKIDNDKKLTINDDSKSLNILSSNTGDILDKINVVNENYFVREFNGNNQFVVWIEGDTKGFGGEHDKIIEWSIYSKNLKNNEIKLIEKSKYKKEDIKLKEYETYEPNSLELYNDSLVYRSYDLEDGNIISKINYKKILENEEKVIFKSKEIIKESVFEPKIFDKYITFLIGKNINNNSNSRQIFKNIDLFLYDIEKNKLEQISYSLPITSSNLYGDKIVFSSFDKDNEMVDSLYIYDIKTKNIKKLLYKNSKIEKFLNKNNLSNVMIGSLELDSRYIYIRIQGDYSPLIYDMEKEEFIYIKDFMDNIIKSELMIASKGDEKTLEVYIAGNSLENKIFEFNLK